MDNMALVSLKADESGIIKEISGGCNAKVKDYDDHIISFKLIAE